MALGVGALGVGAGALRHTFRTAGDDKRRAERLRRMRETELAGDSSTVDVAVTREEAEELRRRGHSVPTIKRAFFGMDFGVSDALIRGIGGGAAGALAGYAGWRGVNALSKYLRKRRVKKDTKDVENRIQRLLRDDPDERDVKLAAYLQAALDHDLPLEKRGGAMHLLLSLIGATSAVGGIAAYRNATASGRASHATQLRKLPQRLAQPVSGVNVRPVVVEDDESVAGSVR